MDVLDTATVMPTIYIAVVIMSGKEWSDIAAIPVLYCSFCLEMV